MVVIRCKTNHFSELFPIGKREQIIPINYLHKQNLLYFFGIRIHFLNTLYEVLKVLSIKPCKQYEQMLPMTKLLGRMNNHKSTKVSTSHSSLYIN